MLLKLETVIINWGIGIRMIDKIEKKQEIKDYLFTLVKNNDVARIYIEKDHFDLWIEVLEKLENWNWTINNMIPCYENLIVVDMWKSEVK